MTEYFELIQSKKVENAIGVMGLDSEKYCYRMNDRDFAGLDEVKVAYYRGVESEEICDILTDPTWMISDELKKLFTLYEPEIKYKAVQLYPFEEKQKECPLYWVPCFPEESCLHADTIIKDNGMVEEVVLDKEKINAHSILRIGGILEYRIVITMPVAESILRRRMYGVGIKRLLVR